MAGERIDMGKVFRPEDAFLSKAKADEWREKTSPLPDSGVEYSGTKNNDGSLTFRGVFQGTTIEMSVPAGEWVYGGNPDR